MPDLPLENYFGDESDGALNTTASVSFASTTDGPTIYKNFTNLTINAGHTVTVSNRCKGLVIYCSGNCVINGTLSMTARGASAPGEYFAPNNLDNIITDSGYKNFAISATGGIGGAGRSSTGTGNKGGAPATSIISTGGGGGGGCFENACSSVSGGGGRGTS